MHIFRRTYCWRTQHSLLIRCLCPIQQWSPELDIVYIIMRETILLLTMISLGIRLMQHSFCSQLLGNAHYMSFLNQTRSKIQNGKRSKTTIYVINIYSQLSRKRLQCFQWIVFCCILLGNKCNKQYFYDDGLFFVQNNVRYKPSIKENLHNIKHTQIVNDYQHKALWGEHAVVRWSTV